MFTFAVISCNRMHYLRNCVESILALAGGGFELLVIDNGSTEPGMSAYLGSLETNARVCYVKRFEDRRPNELYRAMTFAIDWSRDRGNRFINFIQDDCQWLRRDDSLLGRVRDGFDSMPEVAQIHTSLIWRDKYHKWLKEGGVRSVKIAGRRYLYFDHKPPCDTGFTRVSLFDSIGTWPAGVSLKGEGGAELGEEWLYRRCMEVGAKRVWSLDPALGMLYNAAYVRGYERIGRYEPPRSGFYLRPWTPLQIKLIEARAAAGEPSFIEEFAMGDDDDPRAKQVRSQEGRLSLPRHPEGVAPALV